MKFDVLEISKLMYTASCKEARCCPCELLAFLIWHHQGEPLTRLCGSLHHQHQHHSQHHHWHHRSHQQDDYFRKIGGGVHFLCEYRLLHSILLVDILQKGTQRRQSEGHITPLGYSTDQCNACRAPVTMMRKGCLGLGH